MTLAARILVVVVIGVTVLVAATVTAAAAAIYRGGTIAVEVEESDGGQVNVHVPAFLANVAVDLLPTAIVAHAVDEADLPTGEWRPALLESYAALEQAPDFVLVEVRSGDELIRVAKQQQLLVVDVDSDHENVHVSIPLRTVKKLLNKIDRGV